MLLVSIIVPVYNTAKYLRKCLDCLINQTYKEIEIICINDGSKDNSLQILEEYAEKDKRIKVYSQENLGVSQTRNRGIEYAKGEFITFIDSGDTISENSIESSVKVAQQNDSDIVINFLDARNILKQQDLSEIAYLSTWQIFVKKTFLEKNADIRFNKNLKMGEDAIFSHKLILSTNKIAKNFDSVYNYRRHENQTTTQIIRNRQELFFENIKCWFVDLTDFYNKRSCWEKQNGHLINFLCEQPFTQYIRINWNPQQKQELFDLIRNTINKYGLKANFKSSNKRVKMFKKFLKCKKWQEFELYWLIAHYYLKFIDWKKQKFLSQKNFVGNQ